MTVWTIGWGRLAAVDWSNGAVKVSVCGMFQLPMLKVTVSLPSEMSTFSPGRAVRTTSYSMVAPSASVSESGVKSSPAVSSSSMVMTCSLGANWMLLPAALADRDRVRVSLPSMSKSSTVLISWQPMALAAEVWYSKVRTVAAASSPTKSKSAASAESALAVTVRVKAPCMARLVKSTQRPVVVAPSVTVAGALLRHPATATAAARTTMVKVRLSASPSTSVAV